MTQYSTLNVKLSSLQPNKLKSRIKNFTEVTLKSFINPFNSKIVQLVNLLID